MADPPALDLPAAVLVDLLDAAHAMLEGRLAIADGCCRVAALTADVRRAAGDSISIFHGVASQVDDFGVDPRALALDFRDDVLAACRVLVARIEAAPVLCSVDGQVTSLRAALARMNAPGAPWRESQSLLSLCDEVLAYAPGDIKDRALRDLRRELTHFLDDHPRALPPHILRLLPRD